MRDDPPDETLEFARSLRRNATPAERKLWTYLRAKRLSGYKFCRQRPIAGYIADFICFEAKLIVEADGRQHADSEHDARRDAALAAAGFLTLRLWNADILEHTEGVFTMIDEALRRKL